MPEGPEVLRCGMQLSDIIKGKVLRELKPLSGKLSRKMQTLIFDQMVVDVIVKGKTIFIQLADGREIVSSLGMSGWWYPAFDKIHDRKVYHRGELVDASTVVLKSLKHARVELTVDDNEKAFYVDQRNFGNIKIVSKAEANAIRGRMGVEMLVKENDAWIDGQAALIALESQGRKEIGAVLLNQDILCGIGNIYRAEILYISKINPYRLVSSLSRKELIKIVNVATIVLNIAFAYEGTLAYPLYFLEENLGPLQVDRTYTTIQGPMVYGRREDIFRNEVNRSILAGRTLWWVPNIQH